ncbi:MAG: hydroxyacid dehydrogenase [Clostridia bacterium]|nr:hydroxyacid dehydrogenase [Clostridia bacterium]
MKIEKSEKTEKSETTGSKVKIKILDASTLGADLDLTPITSLGDAEVFSSTPPEILNERLEGCEVAVLNKVKLGAQVLRSAKSLKLICVAATGFDNIDTAACGQLGIALANVPGYSTPSVCQITLAMALYLATHLGQYRDYVSSGAYSSSGVANRLEPVYHEIASMKWGVVGGGAIGSAVAHAASALGAEVSVCRRKKEGDWPLEDIDTLCRTSDIISLHVPLNDSTRSLIDSRRISLMKPGALLINAARGAVTDEKAVADAVASGRLGGFGCDVYSREPFGEDHPFYRIRSFENVCLTPHMAWGSFEARERCAKTIADNIRAYLSGASLNRIV